MNRRRILFGLVAVFLSLAGTTAMAEAEKEKPRTSKKRVLRHIVLFKFNDDVTRQQIQEVLDAFAELPKEIDTIIDFEAGTDVSVENKSKGMTHGFIVTFRDEKGRDIYLPHPAHQQFVKLVGPRLADVLVFDYWTTP